MHEIEPFYNWRHIYIAEEDPKSPFYKRTYSEFEYSQTVYNYYIHPQWDDFGSKTLYIKIGDRIIMPTLEADSFNTFIIK